MFAALQNLPIPTNILRCCIPFSVKTEGTRTEKETNPRQNIAPRNRFKTFPPGENEYIENVLKIPHNNSQYYYILSCYPRGRGYMSSVEDRDSSKFSGATTG